MVHNMNADPMRQDPKAEAFDKDGAPRRTVTIGEDQEVFYGSETEIKARIVEKNEDRKAA